MSIVRLLYVSTPIKMWFGTPDSMDPMKCGSMHPMKWVVPDLHAGVIVMGGGGGHRHALQPPSSSSLRVCGVVDRGLREPVPRAGESDFKHLPKNALLVKHWLYYHLPNFRFSWVETSKWGQD